MMSDVFLHFMVLLWPKICIFAASIAWRDIPYIYIAHARARDVPCQTSIEYMEEKEYLDRYEQGLTRELLRVCTQQGRLAGQLLPSEDLDAKWEEIAQPYMGDAVREIAAYPTVALGWMMYVGMAVAHYWDVDWALYGHMDNLYEYLRDKRGFDCMDEYIREKVLGLSSKDKPAGGKVMNEYDATEELVRMLSTICLTQIRREQIEPQSPMAFHVYVRTVHALYVMGASVELYRLGYKMTV